MTKPLDSAIAALTAQPRTTYIVDIFAPTPRRITNYPLAGGLGLSSIVGSLFVATAGSGYGTSGSLFVTFSGGGGQGAAALAIITAGSISGFRCLSRGWGYTSTPTATIPPPPSGVQATATVSLGITYPYEYFKLSKLAEAIDGSSVTAASISIRNTSNAYTDLWSNAANVRVPFSVQRLWRDANDSVVASELWLEGMTGMPSFAGEYLNIALQADAGRTGETPITNMSAVLLRHAPIPPNTKTPWVTSMRPV
ncbi:MAG: hypothetical protein JWO56_3756 [Acidobacteria bacterium]|nr:hypothetical protein [Acidobacteriota bacterium]